MTFRVTVTLGYFSVHIFFLLLFTPNEIILFSACSGQFTETYGFIKSQNYPRPYPDNQDCKWTIKVAYGMKLNITFQALDLISKGKTCQDFVKLENTQESISRIYCGNTIPPPFISTGNEVTAVFKTRTNTRQNTGFSLKYLSFGEPIPTTLTSTATSTLTSTGMYQIRSVYSLI